MQKKEEKKKNPHAVLTWKVFILSRLSLLMGSSRAASLWLLSAEALQTDCCRARKQDDSQCSAGCF